MKHLRSFFAVLLAAAVCAAVVLFSGCGASVQVQQLTIPGERGSIHATLTTPANAVLGQRFGQRLGVAV